MRARDIMTSPVITVRSGTTVQDAAALLAARRFTALPVVDDDDRLIGIVTEADLVRDRFPRDPRSLIHGGPHAESVAVSETVGEGMTPPVAVMGPGKDIASLTKTLPDARQRPLPIADGSRPRARWPACSRRRASGWRPSSTPCGGRCGGPAGVLR